MSLFMFWSVFVEFIGSHYIARSIRNRSVMC